jgi:hypothetical protein
LDPFTIAALGLGAGGALYGAISGASEKEKQKEEFLRRERELAQRTALRGSRKTGFFDPRSIDANYRKQDVARAAEENFKTEPADFLPFVQSATQLAGGIYDAANAPAKKPQLPPPSALQAYDYSPSGPPGSGLGDALRGAYGPYEEDPLMQNRNRWSGLA